MQARRVATRRRKAAEIGKTRSKSTPGSSYDIVLQCPSCNQTRTVGWRYEKSRSVLCKPCAMKEVANRPDILAKRSEIARAQVLRQGGIPGARHDNIRGAQRGPLHYNWKGGVSSERTKDYRSEALKAWRIAIFERDDFTCKVCGSRGDHLQAHHILKYTDHKELRHDVSNGVTVCRSCHVPIVHRGRMNNPGIGFVYPYDGAMFKDDSRS